VDNQPHCSLSYLNSKQCTTLCAQPASLPVSAPLKRTIGSEYFVLECVFMTLLVAILQHLVNVHFWMEFDKDAHTEVSQILANCWPYPVRTVQTLFPLTAAFNTAPCLRQLVAGLSPGRIGSILGRSVWDLWWKKCNWEKFFSATATVFPNQRHYTNVPYSFYCSR